MWWPERPTCTCWRRTSNRVGRGRPALRAVRFHEMWIDGISFVLNGTRVKLRSQWCSGASGMGAGEGFWEPAKRMEAIFARQTNAARVWRRSTCFMQLGAEDAIDIADETGMMAKFESNIGR